MLRFLQKAEAEIIIMYVAGQCVWYMTKKTAETSFNWRLPFSIKYSEMIIKFQNQT